MLLVTLGAVLFLFETVLGQRLAWMNGIVRAQRPVRLPVVLSRDEVASLLARFGAQTVKPLVAYPNRGDAWDVATRRWIASGTTVAFDRFVPAWRAAGARLIGGCCGTTPSDISAIVAALR